MMRPRRPGYTLLEVLIASVIGLMLMGAVYVLFDITIRQQNDGRDLVTESNLSRGVIQRMSLDLASPLGTLPPKSGGTPPAAASTTTTTTETTEETTPVVANIPFQSGIVSSGSQMVVFVSKPVSYLRNRSTPFDPAAFTGSDLLKITYYMHSSGLGLCRQERPWVTSEGIWNSAEPDRATEEQDLIAPEVSNITYEFASGSGWVSDWDGQLADTNGATNQGPPRAVRITLTLALQTRNGVASEKTVQHTFPIRASSGLLTTTPPEETTPPAEGTTP